MPIIGDRVEIERKPKLGGGGPGKIPHRRGYGGGGDDGDHDRHDDFSPSRQRLRRGRIGIAIGIVCISGLFIGLAVVYVARLITPHWDPALHKEVYGWTPFVLPYLQLWINTMVLVMSSLALEMARRGMEKKMEFSALGILPPRLETELPWLSMTVALGFSFLAGQVWVWNNLRTQGVFLHGNPGSSFFYILTGLHALHLLGGLAVLLYAACGNWVRMRFESQRIAVDVTAWYWHFMAILWLGIFALLHFARP
jgi:cytochrome c oxidase subunit III